eukprot:SAG31_NODE_1682_length_7537_cov_4.810164_4_plen_77_part_00
MSQASSTSATRRLMNWSIEVEMHGCSGLTFATIEARGQKVAIAAVNDMLIASETIATDLGVYHGCELVASAALYLK